MKCSQSRKPQKQLVFHDRTDSIKNCLCDGFAFLKAKSRGKAYITRPIKHGTRFGLVGIDKSADASVVSQHV